MRIDKALWYLRLAKTRGLAQAMAEPSAAVASTDAATVAADDPPF